MRLPTGTVEHVDSVLGTVGGGNQQFVGTKTRIYPFGPS